MELVNKSGAAIAAVLVMVGMLIACQAKDDIVPPAPVIQAVAQKLGEHGGVAAERRLREWSEQGSPVAMRELGVLYRHDLARQDEAMRLFEQAARAGDSEAAFQLAEMYREATAKGDAANKAWPWYVQAAEHRHAKATLMLAALARNGEGMVHDEAVAGKWRAVANNVK